MCGIAGAIGEIEPWVIDKVTTLNTLQKHRGPDSQGNWVNDSEKFGLVLGHTRLSIIDTSDDGRQPMADSYGNQIVFNGEIYNYQLLRDELITLGEKFATHTDTEVLLVAYRVWGMECIHRLRGMFAFAIWDVKQKNVFMCRDRLGIKPLYYCHHKGRMFFSSEIKSLIQAGLTSRKLNPTSLESYLWNGYVAAGTETIISEVNQLAPGTLMQVNLEGRVTQQKRYWTTQNHSHGEIVTTNEIHESLRETVKIHLISDVPVGVFLSGGVDSSVVSALAAEQTSGRVATYNLGFKETQFSEAPYARAIAAELGTDHHEILLERKNFTEDLQNALNSLDQPSFDGINTFIISKAIRDAGITVALAGTGGDELFGGYRSFAEVPKAKLIGKLMSVFPKSLIDLSGKTLTQLIQQIYGDVPPQVRWGKLADLLDTKGQLLETFQTSYALFTKDFQKKLLKNRQFMTINGHPENFHSYLKSLVDDSPLESISRLELSTFISERLMRDTDATSMAASLEVRVPLLDHEFVEKSLSMNLEQRFSPLGQKQVLRGIASKYVSPKHFERPKSGFVLPFDEWCRDSLKSEMTEVMNNSDLCESVGLDSVYVRKLFEAYLDNKRGLYWSRVWSIYVFLDWCRRYSVSL